ncbi:hypothetical protein [Clostridium celatum]|uniref:Uncharacterized protein n=1 Tax=Clostridium celatum DSM 1785 TaxID=545697 RepID=L1QPF2_9CLOT|nr:hypothetical protein [Clostridium celatum]EKY29447.1 hypothetical protein HMPREF0216_00212 [Clostridium celatum DSM 1785]MCE9655349.1 hypothetical protein [Clostridium celatum]MDU2266552.1 hypothetical protein [Clostridium celatum]MDU6296876.1 hypothetical protein [Clostridium celatum]MDY3361252.1 hypothetical protein [Clostridium celatum]
MTKEKSEKLREIYDTLLELGVTFYYGSESIAIGEVTDIIFNEDDTVNIELDNSESFKVEIEDFEENHSKEGNNYHTWNLSREFDSNLN